MERSVSRRLLERLMARAHGGPTLDLAAAKLEAMTLAQGLKTTRH